MARIIDRRPEVFEGILCHRKIKHESMVGPFRFGIFFRYTIGLEHLGEFDIHHLSQHVSGANVPSIGIASHE